MEDLDNEEEESTRKRDIDQRDLLANYKKSPSLPDNEISNREHSPLLDNIPQIDNSHAISSNPAQRCISSSVHSVK